MLENHLTNFCIEFEKKNFIKKVTFAFFTQETWIVPSISSLPLMVWNKPSFLPNHTEKLHSTPYNSGRIHMQKTNLFTLSQLPLREQNESIFTGSKNYQSAYTRIMKSNFSDFFFES